MNSHDILKEHAGKKVSRKSGEIENSIIISREGEEFVLLAGKTRLNNPTSFLGQGVHGRVKQAKTKDGTVLAIKIFEMGKYRKTNLNIETEFKVLTKLDAHPTLVTVGKKAYLFQPVIKGEPLFTGQAMAKESYDSGYLADLVKNLNQANEKERPFFKFQIANLMLSIIQGIHEIHLKGVLHNDLHPGNILFDPKSQVATPIDFGKANLISEIKDDAESDVEEKVANDFSFCLSFIKMKFDNNQEDIRLFQEELAKIDLLLNWEYIKMKGSTKAFELAKSSLIEIISKWKSHCNTSSQYALFKSESKAIDLKEDLTEAHIYRPKS